MNMNIRLKIVLNPLRRPSLLFLLSGMLAASIIFLRIEANRQERAFKELEMKVAAATGSHPSPDAAVIEAVTSNIRLRMHLSQVYNLYFYISLVAFVLLNAYIYFGMRGLLPWQR